LLHGWTLALTFYLGLGGVCAPLAAQAVIAKGIPWPQFYYGSLVISGLNFVFLLLTYRPTENELLEEQRTAAKIKRGAPDDYFSGAHSAVSEDGYSQATSMPITSRRQHSMAMYFIYINLTTDYCIYSRLAYSFVAPFLDLRGSRHTI
jgi:hypothetical protein